MQKFLAQAGVCSRREAELWIREGRVRVNGEIVSQMGVRIDPRRDRVSCDGAPVAAGEHPVYLMLNKPRGVVTSCRHPGKRTVLDLVSVSERVFPVGRLDEDSTGLLILTNDGRLHQRLCHPSFDHRKEYEVSTARPLDDAAISRLAGGIPLEGRLTRPAEVRAISERRFAIVLQEGRKRQIRRMVEALGHRVVSLQRVRMATLRLGKLPEGQWRYLTEKEVRELLAAAGVEGIGAGKAEVGKDKGGRDKGGKPKGGRDKGETDRGETDRGETDRGGKGGGRRSENKGRRSGDQQSKI